MGNEVKWLHRQLRVAKKLQQEYGQGVAGMLQEYLGWVKRPKERPQAIQKWVRAAVVHRRSYKWLESCRRCGRLLNYQGLRCLGWLTHYHGRLNRCSRGQAAWPGHLGMRPPSACPQSFQLATC